MERLYRMLFCFPIYPLPIPAYPVQGCGAMMPIPAHIGHTASLDRSAVCHRAET